MVFKAGSAIALAQPLRIGSRMIVRISRNSLPAVLAAFVIPLLAGAIGVGVVLDRHDEDLHDVAVVGPHFMSVPRLDQFAKELTSRDQASARLLIISAFANSDDAGQTLAGKGRTEITYDEAVDMLRAAQTRGAFRMMRLFSVDKNSVVQTVNGPRISRVILSGADPTLFEAGGRHCEILEVYFRRLPRPVRPDGRNPILVNMYVTTDRLPTDHEAEAITRTLQNLIHHQFVSAHIRSDRWFLEDPQFPLWYPFSSSVNPPTYQQFASAGEMYCSSDETGVRCSRGQFP